MTAVSVPANATTSIGEATVYSAVPIGTITIAYQSSNTSALNLQYVRDGSTIQTNALSTTPNGTFIDNTQLAANSNHTITVNAVNPTAIPVVAQFSIGIATQSV